MMHVIKQLHHKPQIKTSAQLSAQSKINGVQNYWCAVTSRKHCPNGHD